MAAVTPDWCDQQVCSFSFSPLSVILNERDELNQTCQTYWGCFDPTGKHLQAYLEPLEPLAIYIPLSSQE